MTRKEKYGLLMFIASSISYYNANDNISAAIILIFFIVSGVLFLRGGKHDA